MASAERSAIAAAPLIERLRQKLRDAERATGLDDGVHPLVLGIPAIDGVLGGGLSCGALHEIAAARETEIAAATGFALALSARAAVRPPDSRREPQVAGASKPALSSQAEKTVVWIAEDFSLAENGAPYGPGLEEAGLSPERLIMIAAARGRDVLWAMEEALRCPAVALVIGESRGRGIDPVATRRLSLAAAAGNTFGLLLASAPDDTPCPAVTRWVIASAPSRSSAHGVGPPCMSARLVRNRRGHLGTWIVEWDSVEQRFVLPTHSELMAGAARDRPHPAAVA